MSAEASLDRTLIYLIEHSLILVTTIFLHHQGFTYTKNSLPFVSGCPCM